MSIATPEADVAAALATALTAALGVPYVVETDIFTGEVRSPTEKGVENAKVWVSEGGGADGDKARPYLGQGQSLYTAGMRITCLHKQRDGSRALARQVRAALHMQHAAITAASTNGTIYCLALSADRGEPAYRGRNEAQQHKTTTDLKLQWVA